MYLGDGINRIYFPVFVPVGVTGNILSFLVNHIIRFTFAFHKFADHLNGFPVKVSRESFTFDIFPTGNGTVWESTYVHIIVHFRHGLCRYRRIVNRYVSCYITSTLNITSEFSLNSCL